MDIVLLVLGLVVLSMGSELPELSIAIDAGLKNLDGGNYSDAGPEFVVGSNWHGGGHSGVQQVRFDPCFFFELRHTLASDRVGRVPTGGAITLGV